jgi:hypothetical protein
MSKKKYIICKPCWEIKYCLFGVLVEQFPLFPDDANLVEIKDLYAQTLAGLANGEYKTEEEIRRASNVLEFASPSKWERVKEHETTDILCRVYGHACPVFFVAEPFTETKVERRYGRYIPREIMLKVVRRDGQICQICHKIVPDNDIEFDHIIPDSKGGPISVENLRVLCSECNGRKSDYLKELLKDDDKPF